MCHLIFLHYNESYLTLINLSSRSVCGRNIDSNRLLRTVVGWVAWSIHAWQALSLARIAASNEKIVSLLAWSLVITISNAFDLLAGLIVLLASSVWSVGPLVKVNIAAAWSFCALAWWCADRPNCTIWTRTACWSGDHRIGTSQSWYIVPTHQLSVCQLTSGILSS